MEKVVKFRKDIEKRDSERLREKYKKDFQNYIKRREAAEKLLYIDTRKQM